MILGFADITIVIVYSACILIGFVCAAYGIAKWNSDDDEVRK